MSEETKKDLHIEAKKCKISNSITKEELENMTIRDVIDYVSCAGIDCENCKLCIIEDEYDYVCIKRSLITILRDNFNGDN